VPNEPETQALTGLPVSDEAEAIQAAHALRQRCAAGTGAIVLTLGARGALVLDDDGSEIVPTFQVRAVDTTAAGDAFCGALAVALAERRALREAVRFACAAGALACTVMGAGPSLPHRAEIEGILG
jgi:ribokinase